MRILKSHLWVVLLIFIYSLLSFTACAGPESSLRRLHQLALRQKQILSGPGAYFTYENYTIVPGDNIWDLSRKFGLRIDTLVSFNRIKEVHKLWPGQQIKVPNMNGILKVLEPSDELKDILFDYRVKETEVLYLSNTFSNANTIFLAGAGFSLSERAEKLGMEFLAPLKKFRITSLFGWRIHPVYKTRKMHQGIDLGGNSIGTPVYAAMGGRINFAGSSFGYGNLVIIKHRKGYESRYGHLDKIYVRSGQQVAVGQPIGTVGNTGVSTGPHLHFEILQSRKRLDPRDVTDLRERK